MHQQQQQQQREEQEAPSFSPHRLCYIRAGEQERVVGVVVCGVSCLCVVLRWGSGGLCTVWKKSWIFQIAPSVEVSIVLRINDLNFRALAGTGMPVLHDERTVVRIVRTCRSRWRVACVVLSCSEFAMRFVVQKNNALPFTRSTRILDPEQKFSNVSGSR